MAPLKVITYKNAHSSIDALGTGAVTSGIDAYSFGYETKISHRDLVFGLKVIATIPYKQPMFLKIWLGASKAIKGKFSIIRNGSPVFALDAYVDKQNTGELTWVIR
jgi:hypothetical protein